MKNINFNAMLLAFTVVAGSGVICASAVNLATVTNAASSVSIKDVTNMVNSFDKFLSGMDLNAQNLGDLVQSQLDPLVALTTIYINKYAPKSAKSILNIGLNELNKVAAKSIKTLNGTDASAYTKQIKDLHKAVKGVSIALSTAQMFGAK